MKTGGIFILFICVTLVTGNRSLVAAAERMSIESQSHLGIEFAEGITVSLEELSFPRYLLPDFENKDIRIDRTGFKPESRYRDRYGKVFGKLMDLNGRWLQKYWLQTGKAYLSGLGPYPAQELFELRKAEADARLHHKGVWKWVRVLQAAKLIGQDVKPGFVIVEGKIISARKVKGTQYINFGENWRTDFSAAISSNYLRRFKKEGWNFSELINKSVRIRGRVRNYNGPFMDVYFPEQVEVIE